VAFRSAQPNLEIGIDGGIKEGNIAQIARSGVDVIYVGSAIFRQPQPGESYRHLLALAEANAPK
jgi:ribulose-phosphate 3-epimerase